jgi:hypothetical protein
MLRQLDSARVLRYLGLRDQIHPFDVVAFVYPDRACFDASAKRDRELYGNDVLGPWETEAGLVGIVDMRPQMLAGWGMAPTDPALPDDITSRSL